MFDSNVNSLLLCGEYKIEYILFKCAIDYAESGLQVWFISSQPFQELPEHIGQPDKEILKLITFLYIKDSKDLISHLNGIHMWQKPPQVIIVNKFVEYCSMPEQTFNLDKAAMISAALLDAASSCAKKYGAQEVLLVTHKKMNKSLKTLVDLYFKHTLFCDKDNCDTILSEIKHILI